MIAIVLAVATLHDGDTEKELQVRGYRKREVWTKSVDAEEKEHEEGKLARLGVAQFTVCNYWGRGGAD